MVIRVYPDGRPVPEDLKRPLPRDDDMDELTYSRLPSIKEIEAASGSTFYGKNMKDRIKRPSFITSFKNRAQRESIHPRGYPLPYERMILRDIMNDHRGMRYY